MRNLPLPCGGYTDTPAFEPWLPRAGRPSSAEWRGRLATFYVLVIRTSSAAGWLLLLRDLSHHKRYDDHGIRPASNPATTTIKATDAMQYSLADDPSGMAAHGPFRFLLNELRNLAAHVSHDEKKGGRG